MTPATDARRGQLFMRCVKALAVAQGDHVGAMSYAASQGWSNSAQVVSALRDSVRMAAVTPQSTQDLTPPSPLESDFAAFVRPLTVLGRLVGLRRVPARVRSIAGTGGASANWAGEKNPVPISKAAFSGATLEPQALTAIIVQTMELFRSSSPASEQILSRDLAAATVAAADTAFLDPVNAGAAYGKPQSVTNAGYKIHSSGSTLSAIDSDLQLLIQALSDAGSDLSFAAFVTRPRTAIYLAALRGSGGAPAFPGIGAKGGTLLGLPVLTSSASPSDIGSPAEGGEIVCLDPSQILVADDDNSTVEASTQASITMADNPGSPATETSLFQTEAIALKLVRFINWRMVRPNMCITLDTVMY